MVFKFIQLSRYTLTLACHRKQISIIAHIVLLLQLRSQTKMLSLYIYVYVHICMKDHVYIDVHYYLSGSKTKKKLLLGSNFIAL